MSSLGLDVGGANIKIAHRNGYARSRPFPLWQRPETLQAALSGLLAEAPAADRIGLTMTGELADCFQTKAEGVQFILAAVSEAANEHEVLVYLVDGRLVSIAEATETPILSAASNWHVLATYVARYCRESAGILIDLGSTTCDIIPIESGKPTPRGLNDPERLITRELVYTGVERSPICAVVEELPWRDESCPVAQELFATTLDAYLVLGQLPENNSVMFTADGRSRTKANAHARLARSICADDSLFSRTDARRAAEVIRATQLNQLQEAAQRVIGRMDLPPEVLIASGAGEFLVGHLAELLELSPVGVISLAEKLGPEISSAACAFALATLVEEGQLT